MCEFLRKIVVKNASKLHKNRKKRGHVVIF